MPHVRCPACRLRQEGHEADACARCDTPLVAPRQTSERFQRVAAFTVAQQLLEARGRRPIGRTVAS
jgi:hypothetical protein